MNELHKAYQALGLEPGAAFDTIKRRYRRLALVWHPDRMSSADAKREAEEELKKINNNFEKLKKHFESEHKSGPSCLCQSAAAGPPPNTSQDRSNQNSDRSSSSGPSEAERKRQEEEVTRNRTAERERKVAQEEAARRAAQAAESAQQKQRAADEAIKNEALRKEEVVRWKCTLVIVVTFVALIGYCWVGCAARDFMHWTGKLWDEFRSQFKPQEEHPDPPTCAPTQSPTIERYIPPYERYPVGNPPSWRQQIEDMTKPISEQESTWPFAPPAPPPNN